MNTLEDFETAEQYYGDPFGTSFGIYKNVNNLRNYDLSNVNRLKLLHYIIYFMTQRQQELKDTSLKPDSTDFLKIDLNTQSKSKIIVNIAYY